MAVGMSERGSLHSGLGEWVVQRLTAVYMLFFIVIALIRLSISPVSTHADWLLLSSGLLFQIALLLFIFSLLAHAWLGLKSVFLDYIHPWRLRFLLLMVVALFVFATGVWALLIVIT
ncbi:MAG: succinate dehydrogenase, hydrophobic membrane anchor protein [Gammaproteobacteria bacterium]|nr:succinate dehydrogenase, hydrophobic membrane anchor protein [Gammaproteobacteria bacterium]